MQSGLMYKRGLISLSQLFKFKKKKGGINHLLKTSDEDVCDHVMLYKKRMNVLMAAAVRWCFSDQVQCLLDLTNIVWFLIVFQYKGIRYYGSLCLSAATFVCNEDKNSISLLQVNRLKFESFRLKFFSNCPYSSLFWFRQRFFFSRVY